MAEAYLFFINGYSEGFKTNICKNHIRRESKKTNSAKDSALMAPLPERKKPTATRLKKTELCRDTAYTTERGRVRIQFSFAWQQW